MAPGARGAVRPSGPPNGAGLGAFSTPILNFGVSNCPETNGIHPITRRAQKSRRNEARAWTKQLGHLELTRGSPNFVSWPGVSSDHRCALRSCVG